MMFIENFIGFIILFVVIHCIYLFIFLALQLEISHDIMSL